MFREEGEDDQAPPTITRTAVASQGSHAKRESKLLTTPSEALHASIIVITTVMRDTFDAVRKKKKHGVELLTW